MPSIINFLHRKSTFTNIYCINVRELSMVIILGAWFMTAWHGVIYPRRLAPGPWLTIAPWTTYHSLQPCTLIDSTLWEHISLCQHSLITFVHLSPLTPGACAWSVNLYPAQPEQCLLTVLPPPCYLPRMRTPCLHHSLQQWAVQAALHRPNCTQKVLKIW